MPFDPKTYEGDDAFRDYVEAQRLEAAETATQPLKKSVEGLKKDVKKHKDTVSAYGNIDPDTAKRHAEEIERLTKQSHEKETDAEKALRLATEKHEREMKELRDKVNTLVEDKKTLLVDDQLKSVAAKLNVKPTLIDAAVTLVKPLVSVLDEDGSQRAVIGDQSIPEYMEDWSKTEVGKNFIQAKANTGGGAGGGGDNGPTGQDEKIFDKSSPYYNVTKQIALKKSNPELHAQYKKKYAGPEA